MFSYVRSRSRLAVGSFTAVLLTVLAGCDSGSTGPSASAIQFSRNISLPDAQSLLQSGPTRVEVQVIPGTLVARRVELEEPSDMSGPEQVRSRVTAVTAGTDMATFTLELRDSDHGQRVHNAALGRRRGGARRRE